MNKNRKKPGLCLINNINHSLINHWLQNLDNDVYELIINNNKMDVLPSEIYKFVFLEKLVINNNYLLFIEFPKKLSFLRVLDLSYNSISQLSFHIGTISSLRELNLSFNKIETFPEEISDLKNLIIFDASHNRISSFPEFLTQDNNKLKLIKLNNNSIQTLPDSIVKLEHLQVLNLCHNNISAINPLVRTIKNLESFEILNNPLIRPPLNICIKGRLHIFRYLAILSRQKIIKSAIKSNISDQTTTILATQSIHVDDSLIRTEMTDDLSSTTISAYTNVELNFNSKLANNMVTSSNFDERNHATSLISLNNEEAPVSTLKTKKYNSNNVIDLDQKPSISLSFACSDKDITDARNKIKAYEELKVIDNACRILNLAIKSKIDVDSFSNQLSDGVYLCKYFNTLGYGIIDQIHVPSAGVSKLIVRKCHLNVHNFMDALKKTNLFDERLICTVADILMERNSLGVANTIVLMESKKIKIKSSVIAPSKI